MICRCRPPLFVLGESFDAGSLKRRCRHEQHVAATAAVVVVVCCCCTAASAADADAIAAVVDGAVASCFVMKLCWCCAAPDFSSGAAAADAEDDADASADAFAAGAVAATATAYSFAAAAFACCYFRWLFIAATAAVGASTAATAADTEHRCCFPRLFKSRTRYPVCKIFICVCLWCSETGRGQAL